MGELNRYRTDIEKAGKFLKEEDYEICSIVCGVWIESLFKELVRNCENIKIKLESSNNKSLDKMTLYEIFSLNKDQINQLFKIQDELRLVDLNAIRLIRNQVHHIRTDDETTNRANAHQLYGAYLRFLKAAGYISEEKKEKQGTAHNNSKIIPPLEIKQKEIPPNINIPPEKSESYKQIESFYPSKEIAFYQNINSGKVFIYLRDLNEKVELITPNAEIKLLDPKLFVELFNEDQNELLKKGFITTDQIKTYEEIKRKPMPRLKETRKPMPHLNKLYEYKVHNARAKLIISSAGLFKILAGSTAIEEEKNSLPEHIRKMRKEFIANGSIVVDKIRGLLRFQKDIDFNSPSAASSFISGSSTNGWLCFGIDKK